MARDTVKDLLSKRTLTKREELMRRSIVTDVLNGMADVFKSVSSSEECRPLLARDADNHHRARLI